MPVVPPLAPRTRGALCLLTAAALAAAVAPSLLRMRGADVIVAGPGVTATRLLSEWLPAIAGTPVDTPVFVLEGEGSGGTVVVLGGTHGDEPAGYVAAVVLIERAMVGAGRLIVIPRANGSGFTHNIGQEAHPQAFVVDTPGGPRRFTFGARASNPVHQWPDPQVYFHAGSGRPSRAPRRATSIAPTRAAPTGRSPSGWRWPSPR